MAYYQSPYYGYYPQYVMYPPQTQMVEQTTQNIQPNLNVQGGQTSLMDSYMIWVQGKAGAQSYPVARGTTLPLFDSEGDYVYIKSVDSNGIPLPLVTKILSDPPTEEKVEVVETVPQVDMSNYVTRETYDDLRKKYSELEMRILDLETKPTSSFNSTFTGNTFNNTKKEGKNESKLTL